MSVLQQTPPIRMLYQQVQQVNPQQIINQQGRPNFWALPTNDARVRQQNVVSQQNFNASNLNVQQLSQDLMKLKEQLKKLAERGQQIGANKVKAQEAQSARIKIQQNQQNHFRPNLSADQHALRKNQVNSNLIYYPQMPSHSNQTVSQDLKPASNVVKQNDDQLTGSKQIDLPPSKRQKIYSFMHNKQSKGRVIPSMQNRTFEKPNQNSPDRINIELRLELQIKQLKEKLVKYQEDLKVSNQQKQKLIFELNTVKQNNISLNEQLNNSRKKSSIFDQSIYQQQQKKTVIIIEKLQAEIQYLKSTNRVSFDEVLKSQLQQNKILRAKLDEKTQQLQQIKDDWNHEKKTNESLKSELTIQEMKASTQLRGRQRKLQIQLNDKSNQLQTAKRALQTLDLKYKTALNEIRQKDNFIMNYMVGRAKENDKEDIKKILEQYKIIFPQNRVMDDLLRQQKQIEQLKKELETLKRQS